MAANLADLYQWMMGRLTEANLRDEVKGLEEVEAVAVQLLEGFREAARQLAQKPGVTKAHPPNQAVPMQQGSFRASSNASSSSSTDASVSTYGSTSFGVSNSASSASGSASSSASGSASADGSTGASASASSANLYPPPPARRLNCSV